jgi:hypothetical protein
MNSYDQLAHPPVDGLDPELCEFLAYEDTRFLLAINTKATELFSTYQGAAAFAIVVLQDLAAQVSASAEAYRAAQHATPATPRWPSPTPRH